MKIAEEIELFENLAQYEFESKYYDFHNDFNCVKISLETKSTLTLLFKSIENGYLVAMKFNEVELEKFEYFNIPNVESLTIDNLYRGRFQKKDHLIDFTDNQKGYFYLEFYEGQKMEFWSSGLSITKT